MNQPEPCANPGDPLPTPATLSHPSRTLSTLIRSYLIRLEADGKSPHTISCYGRDLGMLLAFAGDVDAQALDADLLARFLLSTPVTTTHTGAPRGEASLGRIKACLRSFGRYVASVGATGRDPADWIKIKRHEREAPSFLSPAEVKALVKAVAARKGEAAERDLVMLRVLLGTGIRLAELVGLDIGDVRLDEKQLRIRRAKGGKPQVRFLNTELRGVLRKYTQRRRKQMVETDALFLSNRDRRISTRQVQERRGLWLDWAGLSGKITVHGLRHTFATLLYGRTKNLLLVSKALGHARVTTTQVYAHITDDDLDDALESL
ncbi:MAG: tyrosine-type recombinase/integrase [Thermoguttaceae bacterium]|nr:tyrosine-type recombinase/integrase [Thermoguttaceae bacterium]